MRKQRIFPWKKPRGIFIPKGFRHPTPNIERVLDDVDRLEEENARLKKKIALLEEK